MEPFLSPPLFPTPQGESEAERLAKDPMYRLEHGVRDERKAKESLPQIAALQVRWQVVAARDGGIDRFLVGVLL